MNTQGLLDQLLKSASGALSGSSSTNKSQSTGGGSQLGSLLSVAGGGALADDKGVAAAVAAGVTTIVGRPRLPILLAAIRAQSAAVDRETLAVEASS